MVRLAVRPADAPALWFWNEDMRVEGNDLAPKARNAATHSIHFQCNPACWPQARPLGSAVAPDAWPFSNIL